MSAPHSRLQLFFRSPRLMAGIATALVALLLFAAFALRSRYSLVQEQSEAVARLIALAPETVAAEATTRQLREAQQAAALQHARRLEGRGSLSVQATPDDSDVFINDRRTGEAPYEWSNLPVGKYDVRVSRQGYAAVSRVLEVKDGSMTSEVFPLVRDTGTLTVDTVPGGLPVQLAPEMNWDGSESIKPFETKAPIERTLPTGNYQLTVEREGFDPVVRTISISRGETTRKTVSMMPGRLELASVPAGADVYNYDEKVGTTPYILDDIRSEGVRFFNLKLAGYEEASVNLSILYGEVASETVKLERIAPPESE
jgi:hypothetical protein